MITYRISPLTELRHDPLTGMLYSNDPELVDSINSVIVDAPSTGIPGMTRKGKDILLYDQAFYVWLSQAFPSVEHIGGELSKVPYRKGVEH